jgi:hypothetical protein
LEAVVVAKWGLGEAEPAEAEVEGASWLGWVGAPFGAFWYFWKEELTTRKEGAEKIDRNSFSGVWQGVAKFGRAWVADPYRDRGEVALASFAYVGDFRPAIGT